MTEPRPFDVTGAYYDVVYEGKDYSAETGWVYSKANALGVKEGRWLDVGCGTGKHLAHLNTAQFERFGLDPSSTMLNRAAALLPDATLLQGAAPDLPFAQSFHVISSFFAVLSYLAASGDFDRFIANAASRLNQGGVLYFDVWYAPAVLSQRPGQRFRWFDVDGGKLLRLVESTMREDDALVDVRYHFLHFGADGLLLREAREHHVLRYYTEEEIAATLARHGLRLVSITSPFSDTAATAEDWSVSILAST
jgi:SAM-dependent methyltransferase